MPRYKMKVVNPDKNIVSLRPSNGSIATGLLVNAGLIAATMLWMRRMDKKIEETADTLDVPEFLDEKS